MDTLERARRYLARLPVAVSGQGGHKTTFRAACALVQGFALAEADALSLLREWNGGCQPPWSESELQHKVTSAMAAASSKPRGYLAGERSEVAPTGTTTKHKTPASKPTPQKPKFIPATLKRIAGLLPQADPQFVKDRSPLRPDTQTPATFLQRLYRLGERVIVFDVFRSQGRHVCECIKPPYDAGCLDHLIHGCPKGVWFLCNPVDGEFHPNPRLGGKRSRRSEESVTSWRYLLLESDDAEPADWLAALVQMPLRIAAIYTSGDRSIHALVRLDAASKPEWDAIARKLKPLLTVIGADTKSTTAVRLTRLPGCHRGQSGPPAPKLRPPRRRWDQSPLEFDAISDPIWMPPPEPQSDPRRVWTGGTLQELLYLDPNPIGEPICRKPTRQEIHARWLAGFRAQPQEETP